MDKKLKECAELGEEDKMPMKSYTRMHGNAKLTKEQKKNDCLVYFVAYLRGR